MSFESQTREARDYLLALNVQAEPYKVTYSIQTDYKYNSKHKQMMVTEKIYKFFLGRKKTIVLEYRYCDNLEDKISYITEQLELLNSGDIDAFKMRRGKVVSERFAKKHKIKVWENDDG